MSGNIDFPETDSKRVDREPELGESNNKNSQGSYRTLSGPKNSDEKAGIIVRISDSGPIQIGDQYNYWPPHPIPKPTNPVPSPAARGQSTGSNPQPKFSCSEFDMSGNSYSPGTNARPVERKPKQEESSDHNCQGSSKTLSKPEKSGEIAGRFVNANGSDVQINNSFNINSQIKAPLLNPQLGPTARRQPTPSNPEPENPIVSQSVQKCFISMKPVTKKIIKKICVALVNDWKRLGRKLGFREDYLQQLSATDNTPQEVIRDLLVTWLRVNAEVAVVGVLCQALWEVKEFIAVDVLVYEDSLI